MRFEEMVQEVIALGSKRLLILRQQQEFHQLIQFHLFTSD